MSKFNNKHIRTTSSKKWVLLYFLNHAGRVAKIDGINWTNRTLENIFIAAPPIPPSPFVKRRGHWIFELNEIWGELKFFKIRGGKTRGGKGNFWNWHWRGGAGGGRGEELLEMKLQKTNFRMNLKMFSWVIWYII